MAAKSLLVIAGIAVLSVSAAAPCAAAQQPRRLPPRIEINPRPLLYRRCVDWYVVQHRPSGTVLFPQYHCWWVRG